MNDQSTLLEQYLIALRDDASAVPPPDLDPALAAFARRLVRQALPPPGEEARERIWQRALLAARAHERSANNGRVPGQNPLKENSMMMAGTLPLRRQTHAWPLVAALLLALVGVLALFSRPPQSTDDSQPAVMSNHETATPLPVPSATFTATPFPIPSATWAFEPTAVPTSPAAVQVIPLSPSQVYVREGAIIVPSLVPGVMPADPLQPTVPPPFNPAAVQEIEPGTTVTGELTSAFPSAGFHFVAQESGPVYARVESSDITQLGIGHQIISGTGGGGGGGGGSSAPIVNEISASFFAEAGDSVTLIVTSMTGAETGAFTLTTVRPEAQPLAYGDTVEGAISRETPLAYYTFEGGEGDVVTLRVEGHEGFDARLQVSSSPFFSLFDDDSGAGYDPEIYRETLPESGTYAVIVEPSLAGGGTFALSLSRDEALSLDGGAQVVTFGQKQPPQLVFEGHAGETVRINVSAIEGQTQIDARQVSLLVLQDGLALASLDREFGAERALRQNGGQNLLSGSVDIPADGLVTVRVNALPVLGAPEALRLEVALERGE